MRIAMFHNVPSGGAKRAIYEWVRRLVDHHVVDVFSFRTADHAFCDITRLTGSHTLRDFCPRPLFDSPFGRLNQWQRWRDLQEIERLHRELAGTIDAGNYDVAFCHTCIFTCIPVLLQYLRTPSLYYLHEPVGFGSPRHYSRPRSRRDRLRAVFDRIDPLLGLYETRLRSLQRRSLKRTNVLLANSGFTRRTIAQEFHVTSEVCRYGVDLEQFRPDTKRVKGDHVLSVGEMSPRKGFDFLIESLGRIPADMRPPLRLACNIVHEDEESYLRSLASRHKVALTVLVGLTTSELCAEYNSARLCLYSPVLEPFGLVPLEAMACGTPVVGVGEGGVLESVVCGKTGLLVERDTGMFADATESLLRNPKLAEAYGKEARAVVAANWTWERSAAEVERRLLRCAGEGPFE